MEKLGEVGKVLDGICEAIKAMKNISNNSSELFKITEGTERHGTELSKVNLPNEPLLEELKQILPKVLEAGGNLETWLKNFESKTIQFERFVKQNIDADNAQIPKEVLKIFCEKINETYQMAQDFSASFNKFFNHLSTAQEIASKLEARQKEKAEEIERKATSKRNLGAAGTAGLILAGAGIVALGFFSGGAAWAVGVAYGAGAVLGAVGGAVGCVTAVNVKKMRQMADDISGSANKLGVIAKELKYSTDKAEDIRLGSEHTKALQTALNHFRDRLNDKQKIAQLQEESEDKDAQLESKDARIRALEEQLRQAMAK